MRRRIESRHQEREEKGEQISQSKRFRVGPFRVGEVLKVPENNNGRLFGFQVADRCALIRRPPARAPLLGGGPARRRAASDVSC